MPVMVDGIHVIINFPGAGVLFKEVGVKPPGADGGGPIDTTSLRNLVVRTRHPKSLKTLTSITARVQYDAALITSAFSLVNVNQVLSIDFPSPSEGVIKRLLFWGYLDKFDPQEVTEGNQPLANITVEPTNMNDLGEEVLPELDLVAL